MGGSVPSVEVVYGAELFFGRTTRPGPKPGFVSGLSVCRGGLVVRWRYICWFTHNCTLD